MTKFGDHIDKITIESGNMDPEQPIEKRKPFYNKNGKSKTVYKNFHEQILGETRKEIQKAKKEFKKELKEKKEKEDNKKFAVFKVDGNFIYQIVDHSEMGLLWLKYDSDNNKIDYLIDEDNDSSLNINDNIYYPMYGLEVEKKAIILPNEPINYENEYKLDQDIKKHIIKFLDIPNEYLEIVTQQIKFSWVYHKFNTLNYSRALGDFGSGKSRFLDVLGGLHYIPMRCQGAATAAVLFRLIDKWGGTLIMDEADLSKSDESADVIKILNCGYEKDRPVSRCDKNDPNKLDFFNVYCPKLLATRRYFEDKATESRCITNVMSSTLREDIPEILTNEFYQEQKILRQKLLMWMLKNYNKIDPEKGLKYKLNRIEPRLRQITRPILSIIEDKKVLEHFTDYMEKYQLKLINERESSFEGQVVIAMAQLITGKNTQNYEYNFFDCGDICNQMKDNGYETKNGYNHRGVGKSLRSLGIDLKQKKINGKNKKIIDTSNKDILIKVFKKYIFDEELASFLVEKGIPVTEVTKVTKTFDFFYSIGKSILGYNQRREAEKLVIKSKGLGYLGYFGYPVTFFREEIKVKELIFPIEIIPTRGIISINDVYSRCPQEIKVKFEEHIQNMKSKGDIYEPKKGFLTRV